VGAVVGQTVLLLERVVLAVVAPVGLVQQVLLVLLI
jgi:hypothetical protein